MSDFTLNDATAKLLVDKLGKTYHSVPKSANALQMTDAFDHEGVPYTKGDYLVVRDGQVTAFKQVAFETDFRPRKEKTKKTPATT